MNTQFLKNLGIGFIFVLAQLLFFQHLSLFGFMVDPIIFYLLWLTSKYERTQLLLLGAILGLFQDAFFDMWGIHMFAKTLLVFITFNFVKRRSENQLLLWQIFLIILGAAVIHNIILLGFSSFFDSYTTDIYPLIYILGNAIYTAVIGALLFVFKVR